MPKTSWKYVIHDNNINAHAQIMMKRIAGEPEFGSGVPPRRRVPMSEVPAELRPIVEAAVGPGRWVDTFALQRRLSDVVDACMEQDRGWLGKGLFGVIGGPDHIISPREERRAARREPLVTPVMDYIRWTRDQ